MSYLTTIEEVVDSLVCIEDRQTHEGNENSQKTNKIVFLFVVVVAVADVVVVNVLVMHSIYHLLSLSLQLM